MGQKRPGKRTEECARKKYVQDMVELFAKPEGELTKEGPEATKGIPTIIIRGEGR